MNILLLLLIGRIFSSTYIINDILYSVEYPITSDTPYIYAGNSIYLRMQIVENKPMEIQLTTYQNLIILFSKISFKKN